MSTVAQYEAVTHEIAAASVEAGRPADAVSLVAVTKTIAAEGIWPVIAAGHRVFGENRVQEAKSKWPELKERQAGIELHLIGPLQSNKAKEALALFDVIQTVDRTSLCAALAKEIDKLGHAPRLLVQVNTGAEPQKAGVLPEEADAFIAACRGEFGFAIDGLMCIPPADEAPGPHFALLGKIAERNGLKTLSMGMSADYVTAVRLGATHVRVGSAIFGERPKL
ncbi:hypothetical protein GJW-30_1_00738 [Variibacter gotjawalensis]|uniref:Pyridoxal phosphate homeostasis protein n=1 Tax=Variibacter gotjawalensis TaxID=1333996 RepID=A0A0S3PQJ0_9BRAD|nr:YggS family pyridoxal phosphate-dependent enzyme [Variibacter gotjawalensis]NIK48516.1 hypothetical protein [Variibacter gotjawalensis]RZS50381.1 hypothetical protein EV661_2845 [Variibacter gotjawalensis]BAT58216.1 hypothetical protein GJW-30_1_00738 [Variibacter gotjawalensis]